MYAQLSLIISLHLFILPKYHAQVDHEKYYLECNKTFDCGENVKGVGYPFWGGDRPEYCGLEGLKLSCENEKDGDFPVLDIGFDAKFHVLYINMSRHEIEMERADNVSDNTCPPEFEISANFSETLFDFGRDTEDLYVFYDCPQGLWINAPVWNSIPNNFTCAMSQGDKTVGFFGNQTLLFQFPFLQDCKIKVRVPVNRTALEEFKENLKKELQELLNPSFVVFYRINDTACSVCVNSGGVCWSGIDSSTGLTCLCNDGAYLYPCPKPTPPTPADGPYPYLYPKPTPTPAVVVENMFIFFFVSTSFY